MSLYYLDTSALIKLYVREAGTDRMLRLASRTAGNQLAVLALAQVETHSALRRRQRAGAISGKITDQLLQSFQRHVEGLFLRQNVTDAIIDTACELADRHALFALDAIQLAGYFALKASSGEIDPVFVSADRDLLEAAAAEGVGVLNPCE
ncbi:MAG TPA: type II toxin-antitoxin system VapC family toxin [Terriglobales bacterium]